MLSRAYSFKIEKKLNVVKTFQFKVEGRHLQSTTGMPMSEAKTNKSKHN